MLPILFTIPAWVPLIGGAPITSFGVMMFLAFLVGGFTMRPIMKEKGMDPERSWDVVFMGVIGDIVGAKLYYVLLNWQDTAADPFGMIFSRGGMVWYGGFLGATALIVWDTRRAGLPLGVMADIVAAPLALSYAVGRVGCFLVGDDWGRPTDLPWGIAFPEGTPPTTVAAIERAYGITVDPALIEKYGNVIPVHPTQLYEVGLSLVFFAVLWRLRSHLHRAGWLFMLWLILAGGERFLVEIVRVKDDRFLGPLTIAQFISMVLVGVGIWGMMRLWQPDDPEAGQTTPGRGATRRAARRRARA
ncbi:MAG: prolipoprotein diacylglyceryl transferase [Planctomycetota bacterium]|jgi:phosphatidylglycerol:prolipoprotein diacylglycerol transferase